MTPMERTRIYLDHNGSTPVTPEVSHELRIFVEGYWGNAGAGHPDGLAARAAIAEAKARVAAAIGASGGEIVLTSGGTESNNLAMLGAARARAARDGRRHLVLARHEHLSVVRPAEQLAREGFEVTWVDVDPSGAPSVTNLAAAIRPDTALVALMLANNETGILQPVAEVSGIVRAAGAWLFVDAVCGAGKVTIDVERLGCDLVSVSGHKLHAPKGIGALWMREGVEVAPLMLGCGQQDGLRSGTENTLGAVGLGAAMERHAAPGAVPGPGLRTLRDRLLEGIAALGVGAVRNGTGPDLPNTASVWFPGHDALDLQRALGEEGLSVTAQASRAASEPGADLAVVAPSVPRPSHVLRAMGCDDARATQSLRFSLGSTTRAAEVEGAIDILERVLKGTRIEPSA